ncbi:outer membrane transport energization protein ExbD [Dongia mobilis]|uniref:Biopolymer transport protein ExbD n=1 Tax=Dongia mobilis TaxID=578943 RepID=A0A4R6WV41_9PROT|nr:TonB system transport protein ExbD [Dongia mobilis]TDQ83884.1 outer membrane transport energization protein ExbD [Dongia mobilis]
MAIRLNHGPAGEDLAETHEINVTPFIDVILVLLIIFMVAAPLSTVDVPVDLPAASAQPQPRPEAPLFVTIGADLALSLGNEQIPRDLLGDEIAAATGEDKETRIFLRADEKVDYGEVMQVMNLLRQAGYLKIALVALEQTGSASPQLPAGAATPPSAAQ